MEQSELDAMLRHDEHHWWYRGRRRVLRAALDRAGLPAQVRLLDAGCGSGRTLDDLALRGPVSGVDLSEDAAAAARRRGHDDVRVGPVETLPYADASFDVVTCLDVIEHTEDDGRTLRELLRVTRPGGVLIVTVPAHPWLWSHHDVVNRHYRRYRMSDLRTAAANAGWEVEYDTYFNSLLLAPAAIIRRTERLRRAGAKGQESDLELTSPRLDKLLEAPLAGEAALIAAGARVPFGTSLLATLRAPADRVEDAPATSLQPVTERADPARRVARPVVAFVGRSGAVG